mmetsp:Transcript_30853/g.75238  ORF Transcript_30853/g.75238 Transcript_30853/m.75238 type:complete len:142 (-) Transcript_30853:291-716(-)|eukprot:CAMPEP_0114510928 /NCGR_PEP_ID=MMETSP0109-20121206/14072_1 /TAXON_ID=29199 /ORGANISM="Chlorarachnion reptans, Strain CCCM449" /LENGTH=141 /DNA_ID=CAMNT_0001690315 /DNA_START=167 /DNA_END=592 /DNA_ORIENTATION=+
MEAASGSVATAKNHQGTASAEPRPSERSEQLLKSTPGATLAYVLDHKGTVTEVSSSSGNSGKPADFDVSKGVQVVKLLESVGGLLQDAGMQDELLRKITITSGGKHYGVVMDSRRIYVVESHKNSSANKDSKANAEGSAGE